VEKDTNLSYVSRCLLNLLWCVAFLLLVTQVCFAKDYCLDRYGKDTKRYLTREFGIDFPWWYGVAVYKTESNCVWRRSLDGHGSIGIAQITPKWWDKELIQKGFAGYKTDSSQYIQAFSYILKSVYDSVTEICRTRFQTKKLWITFQGYNRSIGKLNREVKQAGVCVYEVWRYYCKEVDVCVWKNVDGSCKQWCNGCDINGSYSVKIYKSGTQLRREVSVDNDGNWYFW